jgi:metallo-beta-lactamase class B
MIQLKRIFILFSLLFAGMLASAQTVNEPKNVPADFSKPYPPFRIAGQLYYVGTTDLACYLIVTPKGDVLINTGLASSAANIKANIEALGFQLRDIKILLTTQAHYDHMGAMAAIQKATGATMMVDEGDVPVATDGGNSDYALGGHGSFYQPVKVGRVLHNGDTISLGGVHLVILHHPGHTKGSCSYLFTVKDEQRSYTVLIANMPTVVTSKKFNEIPEYPNIAADYQYTFKAMKPLKFDIWLASHSSQFGLETKHPPGSAYNPAAFIDQKGYDDELNELQTDFEKKMAGEENGSKPSNAIGKNQ